jgi:ribose transport system permease protein
VLVLILGAVAIVVWYGLEHTPAGRGLAAAGSNRSAAELLGLRTRRYVFVRFVLAGTLAGLGGVLQVAVEGTGNPASGGLNVLLPGLAAAFLGATAFRPAFNVPGTVIGLLFVATGGLPSGTPTTGSRRLSRVGR